MQLLNARRSVKTIQLAHATMLLFRHARWGQLLEV